MAESPAEAWVTVFCQRTYNPYQAYGRRNPAFRGGPGLEGRLLDFKEGNARAIESETAVLLGAGLKRPRDGLVAPVARDEDDGEVGEFRHGLHQLDPVGPGQHQVQQHQPGLLGPEDARQLPGVAGRGGAGGRLIH